MTAKADTALRYALHTGIALLCLLPTAALAKDGPYLTWRAKSAPVQQADAPPPVRAPQVPVPPSPYGQVGDPYMHVLTWTAKSGATPQPVASAAPMRRAPVQQPQPQMRQPVQATAPAMSEPAYQPARQPQNYRTQAPQYRAQPMASTLPEPVQDEPTLPAPRQALPDVAAQTPQTRPIQQIQPVQRIPVPTQAQTQPVRQAPAAQPAAAQPPVTTASSDGAYQVPANSPYAARIAAARAAQAKAQAKAQPPQANAKPAGKAAPRADAPVSETASDDDKPFVPGQHYTDASEAPRLYSLHRAYGLAPDPITADSHASGAVLDTSKLDAAEAKAAKDEKADEDSAGDDPDADGVTKTSSSANTTQKASASKKKADQ